MRIISHKGSKILRITGYGLGFILYLCNMKILTGNQFRELDRYTIEHEPVPSIQLMERAAQALAEEIKKRWGKERRIYVFAGPGNNGGDGLALARLLSQEGYHVDAWVFNVKGTLTTDCQRNLERLRNVKGVEVTEVKQGFDFPPIQTEDVVIDALFGTGLNSALNGGFAQVVHKINATKAQVVSIDMPSGLMSEDNTYNDRNNIIRATLTLTIQMPKLAFMLGDNEPCVGEWKAVDIGLSAEGQKKLPTPFILTDRADLQEMLLPRPAFAHKGTFGHALLVAGSQGMAGAAILATRGCLRSGVGKVTLHTAATNSPLVQISVPETIVAADANPRLISECLPLKPYAAVGIGPGLGQDDLTAEALHQYLALSNAPLVIDADAINLLAQHTDWQTLIPQSSILTPHPKELERLTGRCATDYERLAKAMELAIQRQLYIVLKGHHTAVCTPLGRVFFCPAGNSGMATAGCGDVLTGILTGLLAQGYRPREAALLGVWLHATAGDLAAQESEPECLLASDLIAHLPGAFKQLKEKNH